MSEVKDERSRARGRVIAVVRVSEGGAHVDCAVRAPCRAARPTAKAWPLEASGALARVNTARDAAASCAMRKAHGDGPSPCAFQVAA
eukprot:6232587-Prymnesium_polylepis.1